MVFLWETASKAFSIKFPKIVMNFPLSISSGKAFNFELSSISRLMCASLARLTLPSKEPGKKRIWNRMDEKLRHILMAFILFLDQLECFRIAFQLNQSRDCIQLV